MLDLKEKIARNWHEEHLKRNASGKPQATRSSAGGFI